MIQQVTMLSTRYKNNYSKPSSDILNITTMNKTKYWTDVVLLYAKF